ncbi:MAG: putative multidrug export ATP-binding/permease protein [Firmicutes bacterium ADurb.Bin080]|nr:MAG: putative multidrug export ATP-binding/permease protein [Firmicutes bacterium ADurb.Bin080]
MNLRSIRNNARMLLPYLKKHIYMLSIASTLAIFCAFMVLPLPLITKHLLDVSIPKNDIKEFVIIGLLILGSISLIGVLQFLSDKIFFKCNQEIIFSIKRDLLNHVFFAPISETNTRGWGYYISRIEDDTERIKDLFADNLLNIFTTTLRVIITLIACFFLCYQLTLIFIPILLVVTLKTVRYLKNINQELQVLYEKQAEKSENLGESLNLLTFCQYSANFSYPYNKYVNTMGLYLSSLQKYTFFTYTSQMQNVIIISGLMNAVAFGIGGVFIALGYTTIGSLFAFQNFVFNVSGGVQSLVSMIFNLEQASVSFSRINEIKSLPQEVPDQNANNLRINSIRLENITAGYNDTPVMESVSFEVHQGDKILISGHSGCGKSTILKTLAGFLKPISGSIYFNDTLVNMHDMCNFRPKMGVVEQEPYIADDTVSNNIRIVSPESSDENVMQAADKAYVSEFTNNNNLGLDISVGPNGNKLSIGQKQRIAIARAIIRKPDLLLLDEPLSNVDPRSEEFILETIRDMPSDTIVFMVSHKPVKEGIFNIKINIDDKKIMFTV